MRNYRDAVRFVGEAGLAFVFPDNRTPLPSLWGAIAGNPRRGMEEEDWGWTKSVAAAWRLKDELGARRGAVFCRFVRGKGTLVALDLAAALAALVRREDGLSRPAREAFERLGNVGPMSTLRLRESLRLDAGRFNRVMAELHRRLLVANLGTDDTETRWPAAVVGRLERGYPSVAKAAGRMARAGAVEAVRRRLPDLEPRFLAAVTGVRASEWKRP